MTATHLLCLSLVVLAATSVARSFDERRIASSRNQVQSSEHNKHEHLCARISRNASTSHVWNTQLLPYLLSSSADLREKKLFLSTLPAQQLKRSVARHPLLSEWGGLIETTASTSPSEKLINVWILTSHGGAQTSCSGEDPCLTWMQRLKQIIRDAKNALGLHVEVTEVSFSYGTTEFYTDWIQYAEQRQQQPHIILHALSRQDMASAFSSQYVKHLHPTDSVLWEEERRHILQHFIRTVKSQYPDTIVMFLQDYLADKDDDSSSLWAHEVNDRMLQQLGDYYNVGMVSYTQMVERMVYAATTDEQHPLSVKYGNESLHFAGLGHLGILGSLLYSLLDFTNTYCFDKQQTQFSKSAGEALGITEDVQLLVDTVLPPPLDARQTLLTVSAEWQEATTFSNNLVDSHLQKGCFYGVWSQDGLTTKSKSLEGFLSPARVSHSQGWHITAADTLQATQEGALLEWNISIPDSSSRDENYAKLHVIRPKSSSGVNQIKWSATIFPGERVVSEDVVNIQEDSKDLTSVVLSLSSNSIESVTLSLKLEKGISLEIAALFICSKGETRDRSMFP